MSIKSFFQEDIDADLPMKEQHDTFFEDALKEDEKVVKNRYVFPNIMAKWMAKVNQKTQYEASIMSMLFMMFGIIYFIIMAILGTMSTLSKVVLTIELIAAFIMLSSQLITQFQQYKNYMDVMESLNVKEVQNG
jgi:ABC-type multidrug transport system fused ATPase/permease subunit